MTSTRATAPMVIAAAPPTSAAAMTTTATAGSPEWAHFPVPWHS